MEEELKKETAPEEETGKPEPQMFNRRAREAVEAAYQAFEDGEVPAIELPPQEPPVEEKPVEKGMDVSQAKVVDENTTAQPVDEWKPRFKDHRTAEESYAHAQREMSRATTEADKLRKDNAELMEMLKRISAGAPGQPRPGQEEPDNRDVPPQLDKEALEAEFFKDPMGFLMDFGRTLTQATLGQAKTEITQDTRQQRMEGMKQAMTFRLQEHFDSTYPELKPIEPLALDFTEQVRKDSEFMTPLLKSIETAPNELKARKIYEVSKAVMDEGAKRLKERLPDLVKPFGFQAGDQPIQKERLTSGSPPVVPGGGKGPVVKPSPETMGETQEEYISGRLKLQDRMRMSRAMR